MRTGWQLGPNHPDFDASEFGPAPRPATPPRPRSAYRRPTRFVCSACGAEKRAARALCPCGAFRKDGAITPTGGAGAGETIGVKTSTICEVDSAGPTLPQHLVRRQDSAPADPDPRTIRVVAAFVQRPRFWRSDVSKFGRGYKNGTRPDLVSGDAARTRAAAATATLLDLPVGIVTGVREEQP